jgi:carboxypeptidase Taq
MEEKVAELKRRLMEADDIEKAAAVLHWDQSTYMPQGGAQARGRQMATLGRLGHEKFIDPEVGKLLDELLIYAESLPYDDDTASLIRVTKRDYDQATKVPPDFVAELYGHMSESYGVWAQARPENDFAAVMPNLEKTLDYSRRFSDYFPGYDHIADPLIDLRDYGMKAETTRTLFAELRKQLVPLVEAILEQPPADDSCLRRVFDEEKQLAFGKKVIEKYGYDFNRGRLDKTHHPFMIRFSSNDIRITTRVKDDFLGEALFSTLHETGHGLYELGINQSFEGTPLANGTSSGVHESQSRLWENLVGRNRAFWRHYYPQLQETFPEQLGSVTLDAFYRAINKVKRSLIRTDADEITYNLHVMIRFDLELDLLEGKLAIADLPEAWHARYESDLGLRAPDNRDGVMQDVHWYAGTIGGAFQGYTLGNIMSVQFFDQAVKANPGISKEIETGQFETLHNWLGENIYNHGSKYTTDELVERVTGEPLTIEPYMNYLRTKYGELYSL